MKRGWWLAGLALALGCAEATPLEPVADLAAAKGGGTATGAQTLTVMTHNLYVGADVDAVIAAIVGGDQAEILASLVTAYGELLRTDFPSRAEAIADEILKARPHVVGLQELTRLTLDFTALYPTYLPIEIQYQMEFLPYLMDALDDRELDYDLITVKNIDVDVAPVPGTVARLEDWDGMLIRGDLTPTATGGANFTACLGPSPCLGGPLPIKRGYVWATIPINGVPVTFVSSHPESGNAPDIAGVRLMQIVELMQWLGPAAPVVLMGDLNEDPGADLIPGYPSVYEVLMGAQFNDVWRELRPGAVGFTCCHASDLSDRIPAGFDERIDYILTRGIGRSGPGLQGSMAIVGLVPSSRIAGPLGMIWPSDHAGLVANLLFPPAWAGTK